MSIQGDYLDRVPDSNEFWKPLVILLGLGKIGMATYTRKGEAAGVAFTLHNEAHEIGEKDSSVIGKSPEEFGSVLNIESINSQSMQILIEHLEEAKEYLVSIGR